jgi:rRNA processing protein Gar1
MLQEKGMVIAENTDKLSQRNISNIDKKRKQIGRLFSLLYKVMGYKRYMLFVKSLYNYCRPELHTFLIHKDSH